MCGICGVIGMEQRDAAEAVVRRMMDALHHRGPDEEGLLVCPPAAPRIAFGMRRLSIIDLRGGHQPVFNEDGSAAVVLNGEIYNFRELRRELESLGHRFRTRSDTEAVVHAYEQWGEDCVHRLRGMFALVVLDMRPGRNPKMLLARDRLGIKPLYYAVSGSRLIFASEVRALLASGVVDAKLSAAALEAYLLFGSLGEPVTLIENVHSLPPGHRMAIDPARPQDARPAPYWDPQQAAESEAAAARNVRDAALQLRPLLEDAVLSHLVADVPVGVFLSGGLDSTALVALASRHQQHLHTFTVAFPEEKYSEAATARQTATRFGTRHQELLLDPEQMLERLDDAVAALDQPSMDGINTFFVSWAARRVGLKVALSGLGGDEVFGGYSTFRTAIYAGRLTSAGRILPRPVRSTAAAALGSLVRRRLGKDAGRKLAAALLDPGGFPHAYFYMRALFVPEQVAQLCRSRNLQREEPWRQWMADSSRQAARFDAFTRVSCLEMRSYLVNTLLRDTDAMSMSHSLEVRVPLLDHRLVEFVMRLPAPAKRRRGANKALLVEALKDVLPANVVRGPKRTFTLPWEHWLRGGLRDRVNDDLKNLSPALEGALNPEAVQSVWQDFLAGSTSWSRPWSLYVLNQWCRRHLDRTTSGAVEVGLQAAATGKPGSAARIPS